MADPVLMGALIGLAKNEIFDRPREKTAEDRELITLRWSPWTNRKPNFQNIKRADPFGEALKVAATAARGDQAGWFDKKKKDDLTDVEKNAKLQAQEELNELKIQELDELTSGYERPKPEDYDASIWHNYNQLGRRSIYG